jgi:signal transduction histidine kinase
MGELATRARRRGTAPGRPSGRSGRPASARRGPGPAVPTAWSRRRGLVDPALAACLWVLDLATPVDREYSSPWALPVYAALGYLPLAWRRRYPVPVFVAVLAHELLARLLFPAYLPGFALALGLFTVAAECGRRRAVLALLAAFLPAALASADAVEGVPPGEVARALLLATTFGLVTTGVPFGVGRWAAWSVRQRQLVADHAAATAVAAERTRITRDLHDVVAHAVTLMVLQAAGAARVLRDDPNRAEAALRHVDELGQQAIVELRRMLGLLATGPPGASPVVPPPLGLRDIGVLVDRARAEDLRVEFAVAGEPVPLDAGVDLSGYRIVQEALTNAVRYADRRHPVRVELQWRPAGVEIRIVNHGAPAGVRRTPSSSTGRGLVGMRERARAAGGSVALERRPDGGFAIRLALPAAGTAAAGGAGAPADAPGVLQGASVGERRVD